MSDSQKYNMASIDGDKLYAVSGNTLDECYRNANALLGVSGPRTLVLRDANLDETNRCVRVSLHDDDQPQGAWDARGRKVV